ncbi:MAG: IS110-like element ISSfl4 family transposase [Candidatus Dormibacteria bacterium]
MFCGLDVGKSDHHAVALDPGGRRLADRPLPNDEAALRALFLELLAHGPVLAVVDQVASIGALAVAVARGLGIDVGYLPGLTMRRLADLHPGEAKTDARDAFVIADAARALPHTLRGVTTDEETIAELTILAGYDEDLAGEVTRLANRLHDALAHVHPALERLLGPHLHRAGVLQLLTAAPTPEHLRALGHDGIHAALRPRSRKLATRLPAQIVTALDRQSVVIPGTASYGRVIAGLASQLLAARDERDSIAEQLTTRLEAHPLAQVLTSMPGVGVRTAITVLIHVGDASAFRTAGHLAAYAGLAPVTRRSGSSIRGEHAPRRGNKALKRALFLSAFASLRHPASRTYYDRKRAQGKTHTAALLCLARRRTDVLHAMIRTEKTYRTTAHQQSPPEASAA